MTVSIPETLYLIFEQKNHLPPLARVSATLETLDEARGGEDDIGQSIPVGRSDFETIFSGFKALLPNHTTLKVLQSNSVVHAHDSQQKPGGEMPARGKETCGYISL